MLSQSSTKLLENAFFLLGLTSDHARVYLACLTSGISPVSYLAKQAGSPRSTTYNLLSDLNKIGLVSRVKDESKLLFSASSPSQLQELLNQKHTQVQKSEESVAGLSTQLTQLYTASPAVHPKVRFYEGAGGLDTVYQHALLAKEIAIVCQGSPDIQTSLAEDPPYLKKFIEDVMFGEIKTREILEDNPAVSEYKEKYASDLHEMMIIPKSSANRFGHVDKHIYGNFVAYISHDTKVGIIIEDVTIASHERSQFDLLWSQLHKGRVDR